MTSKYNRKYKEYKPTKNGPPTERICKPTKCNNNRPTPPPPPPNPAP